MSNSKIILSNKQVSKELKNLLETFTKPTDEDIKKYENYFKNLKNYLNKLLKNRFPFIDHVEIVPKLQSLEYSEKYYFYTEIQLYIDVSKLPRQEDLHRFVKVFNSEKSWAKNNFFTKLDYFYEIEKEMAYELTNDIIENCEFYMEVLYDKLNISSDDFGYSFYFHY